MKRSMLQCYVKDADAAIALYQSALDAKLLELVRSDDGAAVLHSELDVHGQILAVGDRSIYNKETDVPGNTMQFCLHFAKEDVPKVEKAAAALAEGGQVLVPLGPSFFCSLMIDVIDPFGVRWCVFAD